jgi:hypothetical protein
MRRSRIEPFVGITGWGFYLARQRHLNYLQIKMVHYYLTRTNVPFLEPRESRDICGFKVFM